MRITDVKVQDATLVGLTEVAKGDVVKMGADDWLSTPLKGTVQWRRRHLYHSEPLGSDAGTAAIRCDRLPCNTLLSHRKNITQLLPTLNNEGSVVTILEKL